MPLACRQPPAPAQGRVIPQPQPLPVSGPSHRVKTLATGPFTRGRAAVVTLSQGEGHRMSASLGVRQVGSMEPRPVPTQEKPGVTTRGGSRPAGRGTARRVVHPIG